MEGFQFPVIPFVDNVGKTGTAPPLQITMFDPKLNVGEIFGFTVTLNVVIVAQRPAVGVKV